MARSMASELSPRGIRVNVVSPGAIRTAIWGPAVATPEAEKAFEKRIALSTPLGRLGETDQVAKTVLFLASDDASTSRPRNCSSMAARQRPRAARRSIADKFPPNYRNRSVSSGEDSFIGCAGRFPRLADVFLQCAQKH